MINTLALIDGLPEFVAEQFLDKAWSTHHWSTWEYRNNKAFRCVVLSDEHCLTYFCSCFMLEDDEVSDVEGFTYGTLSEEECTINVSVVRVSDTSVLLLRDGTDILGTFTSGELEYDVLSDLLLSVRNLCCGIQSAPSPVRA